LGIALIQTKIILCSVTFSFSRDMSRGLPGIWDLLLRAGFLQPGSLHSHFSSSSLGCGSPSRTEQCPYTCRAFRPWKGNCSLASLGSCMQLAEPCPLSHLCKGLVQWARPLLQCSGFVGAGELLITQS